MGWSGEACSFCTCTCICFCRGPASSALRTSALAYFCHMVVWIGRLQRRVLLARRCHDMHMIVKNAGWAPPVVSSAWESPGASKTDENICQCARSIGCTAQAIAVLEPLIPRSGRGRRDVLHNQGGRPSWPHFPLRPLHRRGAEHPAAAVVCEPALLPGHAYRRG